MKSISKLRVLILFGGTFLLASCCLKKSDCKCFAHEPVINFLDFEQHADSTARITIGFQDCDGDIGADENDASGSNLLLAYFELRNGNWVEVPLLIPYHYRIPDLEPAGKRKAIEGEIEIDLEPYYYDLFGDFEAIKFEIMLIDKEGNESNMEETPKIFVP